MTIFELNRRLQVLDLRSELAASVADTKEAIVTLNKGQLFLGVRADSATINPEYAEATVEYKKSKGQPYDRVTLRDTGNFWKSIKVDVSRFVFTVYATDWKAFKLVKKYGLLIFGLNKESKTEEYIPNYLKPALIRRIELALGVKFG